MKTTFFFIFAIILAVVCNSPPDAVIIAASEEYKENSTKISYGCRWEGSAPFCNSVCPPLFHFIRQAKVAPQGEEDDFGHNCLIGNKVYCCSWTGVWTSAHTGKHIYCQREDQVLVNLPDGRQAIESCGTLRCSSNSKDDNEISGKLKIIGNRCDTLEGIFGINSTVTAVCSIMIVVHNSNNTLKDTFYKGK